MLRDRLAQLLTTDERSALRQNVQPWPREHLSVASSTLFLRPNPNPAQSDREGSLETLEVNRCHVAAQRSHDSKACSDLLIPRTVRKLCASEASREFVVRCLSQQCKRESFVTGGMHQVAGAASSPLLEPATCCTDKINPHTCACHHFCTFTQAGVCTTGLATQERLQQSKPRFAITEQDLPHEVATLEWSPRV